MKVAKAKLSELREMADDECRDIHLLSFARDTSELADDTPVTITIESGMVTYAAFPADQETVH